MTPAGGWDISKPGPKSGGCVQLATRLKSTVPPENPAPAKPTVPPENSAAWKKTIPPEVPAPVTSGLSPVNLEPGRPAASPRGHHHRAQVHTACADRRTARRHTSAGGPASHQPGPPSHTPRPPGRPVAYRYPVARRPCRIVRSGFECAALGRSCRMPECLACGRLWCSALRSGPSGRAQRACGPCPRACPVLSAGAHAPQPGRPGRSGWSARAGQSPLSSSPPRRGSGYGSESGRHGCHCSR